MNERQAKKKRKIEAIREDYGFLTLKEIKKYDRQYNAYFNSPQRKKEETRQRKQMRLLVF